LLRYYAAPLGLAARMVRWRDTFTYDQSRQTPVELYRLVALAFAWDHFHMMSFQVFAHANMGAHAIARKRHQQIIDDGK
jgi:hypothetical protein